MYCQAIDLLAGLNKNHRDLPAILYSYADFLLGVGRRDEAYRTTLRADRVSRCVEPRATMGLFGGKTVIEVRWDERMPMRVLRQNWHATIQDAHWSIEEGVKLRLEAEHPDWRVANVNAQCNDNLKDFQDATDDDMVTTHWSCFCVVRKPDLSA